VTPDLERELDDALIDGDEPSDESAAVPTAVEEAARDELMTPADETDEG
jgi:hypothetical protein